MESPAEFVKRRIASGDMKFSEGAEILGPAFYDVQVPANVNKASAERDVMELDFSSGPATGVVPQAKAAPKPVAKK
jgi:hypothetical protein